MTDAKSDTSKTIESVFSAADNAVADADAARDKVQFISVLSAYAARKSREARRAAREARQKNEQAEPDAKDIKASIDESKAAFTATTRATSMIDTYRPEHITQFAASGHKTPDSAAHAVIAAIETEIAALNKPKAGKTAS